MSYRTPTNSNDHKIFMRTAMKTKKININPRIMRGGIRF